MVRETLIFPTINPHQATGITYANGPDAGLGVGSNKIGGTVLRC